MPAACTERPSFYPSSSLREQQQGLLDPLMAAMLFSCVVAPVWYRSSEVVNERYR